MESENIKNTDDQNMSDAAKQILDILDKNIKENDITEKQEVKEIKYKKSQCNKCKKDGWIKSDGFDNGERKKRLIIRVMPTPNIICMECLDKEIR